MTLPRHSDHDPLFELHRWKANCRILDVTEIKTGQLNRAERFEAMIKADVEKERKLQ